MQNELNKVELDSDPNGGLEIKQNEDGSFMLEWDKNDHVGQCSMDYLKHNWNRSS